MLSPVRLGAALLLLSSACAHAPAKEEAPPQLVPMTVLGPGDVFDVRVYGEEDLSGTYRVASDGGINFPLVGKLDVANKTPGQVSDELAAGLRSYIKKPSVSVFVKEFTSKKVYVFGQVARPGTFPFEDGMNIIQAITLAGGFAGMADQNGAFVTRIIDGKEQRVEVKVKAIGEGKESNFRLEPGDIVYVPETIF
ncbi:MAG: polysaccharide biosynthesis/export family protein [Deltaproteobacteria bacterium]|nr:polysaccharide biosynthesis/export family protein [Deltaproteobacteria bacterium]